MRVKPAPGVKVRDPYSRLHIPEAGCEVSDRDSFWVRRLLDGDVVLVTESVSVRPVSVRPVEPTTSGPAVKQSKPSQVKE